MKVQGIEKSDKEFVNKQKSKLKRYLNICKYDLIPAAIIGSELSLTYQEIYTQQGALDAALFGGVAGTAFILAVNGVITGIIATKAEKERFIEEVNKEEKEESKRKVR